jgi:two-component system, LytTR family, sensor kinase
MKNLPAILAEYPYQGWRRAAGHAVFWLLILVYELSDYTVMGQPWSAVLSPGSLLLSVQQVLTVALAHYFIAYLAIPRLLLRARPLAFLLSLCLTYVFLVFSLYYTLFLLQKWELLPEWRGRYAEFYLSASFPASLVSWVHLFNNIVTYGTLFFTLSVKLVKDLLASQVKQAQLRQEKLRLSEENTRLELSFLKSQINPHFFFNTLNNIYSLVIDHDEVSADYLLRLADLMRYSLYEAGTGSVPLTKEMDFLREYVALEKITYPPGAFIHLDIQGKTDGLEVPPLLLIALAEQTFARLSVRPDQPRWVSLRISVREDHLSVFTQCPAAGAPPPDADPDGYWRRMALLYPGRYQLTTRYANDRFTLDFIFQLYDTNPDLRYRGRRTTRPALT